ncbi:protein kinase domain-containing protein [Candidatus Solirubrobacter pratensis]|uniref:protein kinase domain-containing protein n=1 Tax=Candidatus Solirubrobacter pratensis TaxID=1298857 RepID=UPI0004109BF1|nr:protein kinase [Candidatus Solirubrobacter pratensis]
MSPDDSTVAFAPPWAARDRPTWGFAEGDPIAPGRTILRRIGGGRRFETFLVWDDHRLAVLVAKVLRPDQASDGAALRELAAEAELLARLAHPVVMRSFGAVTAGRFPHLVLEHLDGPTLAELLEHHGPLALEQLLPLGMHLASALHYLAAERVVHLDVKPSNVVMGAPPRLIDFSVARTHEQAGRVRVPIGTDAYMAPEQAEPDGRLGAPADVYGLCATVYTAAAGARAPTPLPRRTPPALAEILRAGLDPDPGSRPAAADVALALEPLVAAQPHKLTLGRR